MPFKLVIFDLDNTLVQTRPAAKIGYRQAIYHIAKMHGLEKSRDKLYHHWKKIVQNLLGESKPYKRRFAYSLQVLLDEHQLPHTHLQTALNVYEKEMLKSLKLAKGAKELVSSLKEAHIQVAVTTGSDKAEAVKKLKTVLLYQYQDCLVTSSDVEAMQPNPEYYQIVLKELQHQVGETLVLADSLKEDIEPAEKLGLTAWLVTPQTHLMEFKAKIL